MAAPPNGYSNWSDYWNGLSNTQNFYNGGGGNPYDASSQPQGPQTSEVPPPADNGTAYNPLATGSTAYNALSQGSNPFGGGVTGYNGRGPYSGGAFNYGAQGMSDQAASGSNPYVAPTNSYQPTTYTPAAAGGNAAPTTYLPAAAGGTQAPAGNTTPLGGGSNTPATGGNNPLYLPGTNFPTANPFGANPFMANPSANNPPGSQTPVTNFNPNYFATQDTANIVAQMFGGTVTPGNFLQQGGGGFTNNQPQYMVTMPDGRQVNPGFIAQYYQQYADNPNMLARLLSGEATGQTAPLSYYTSMPNMVSNNPNVNYFNPATGSSQPTNPNPGVNSGAPGPLNSPNVTYTAGQGNPYVQQNNPAYFPQTQTPQTQTNPFDAFGSLVNSLYGSNPYTAAAGGNSSLGNVLAQLLGQGSNQVGGQNMGNIMSILNALYAQRQSPSNSILSPLFWGSQSPNPMSNYYPAFY